MESCLKCRFCGAKFSPKTIGSMTVMDRMRKHMERCHPMEWEKFQRKIREACHTAPLPADHPRLYI